MLYRTVPPYRTIPYRISCPVPYRTVFRTVTYRTVPYRASPYRISYRTVPYRLPYRAVPYRTVTCRILYRVVPYRTVHRTVPYGTVPYMVMITIIIRLPLEEGGFQIANALAVTLAEGSEAILGRGASNGQRHGLDQGLSARPA